MCYRLHSRVASQSFAVTAALAGLFMIAAFVGRQFPHLLNGSLIYTPTVILLVAVSWFHWSHRMPGLALLSSALVAFAAALMFRTIDNAVCPWWPVGAHFLWHLYTALALLPATKALIVNLPRGAPYTLVSR